jgi:aspartate 1-decarboxylase
MISVNGSAARRASVGDLLIDLPPASRTKVMAVSPRDQGYSKT